MYFLRETISRTHIRRLIKYRGISISDYCRESTLALSNQNLTDLVALKARQHASLIHGMRNVISTAS